MNLDKRLLSVEDNIYTIDVTPEFKKIYGSKVVKATTKFKHVSGSDIYKELKAVIIHIQQNESYEDFPVLLKFKGNMWINLEVVSKDFLKGYTNKLGD